MSTIQTVLQVIIALGVLNVWLLRAGKSTPWRGGSATNMKEEFAVYGLSPSVMKMVGGLKILFALMLLVGIWVPALVLPAAAGMAVLMSGAVLMHVKVKDSPKKSLPAFTMLVLSVLVIVL